MAIRRKRDDVSVDTVTRIVNPYGCMLILRHSLQLEHRLALTNLASQVKQRRGDRVEGESAAGWLGVRRGTGRAGSGFLGVRPVTPPLKTNSPRAAPDDACEAQFEHSAPANRRGTPPRTTRASEDGDTGSLARERPTRFTVLRTPSARLAAMIILPEGLSQGTKLTIENVKTQKKVEAHVVRPPQLNAEGSLIPVEFTSRCAELLEYFLSAEPNKLNIRLAVSWTNLK